MPTVQDFLEILHLITPEHLAEDWDNVGLLVGDPRQPVHRLLLALDPTCSLAEEAARGCYDLILTHHPIIFRPLKAFRTDTPTGRFLALATQNQISVIASHTNFDSVPDGVSGHLARILGLQQLRPLQPSKSGCPETCGLGQIGTYCHPHSPESFLACIHKALQTPWLLEAGPRPEQVATVAVCGGSCSDFAELAKRSGADVFLTAEVKHSVARWAEDAGLWLLDGGHFATENPAMAPLRDRLCREAEQRGWALTIDVACQKPPLRLAGSSFC
ncbi:MAG: Nif3-like dinuclear metal center hexameric protein [Desulfobulbus sp.]|nr:Nif3-like dinuclear metal center hexameric protein [Desulfobulbus sp.]